MSRLPLALLLLLAGCSSSETRIEVELQSDPRLLEAATDVRLRFYQGRTATLIRDTRASFADGLRLPTVTTVVPAGDDPSREFSLLAELLADDQVVAEQRLVSTFVPGRTVRVVLRFTEGCSALCEDLQTCLEGRCVSACLAPSGERLERYNCGPLTDSGVPFDAGETDAGIPEDGGVPVDGEVPADGGADAGVPDAGVAPCGTRGFSAPWHACVDEVDLGATHTCATRDGSLYCWGEGMGASGSLTGYGIADGSPGHRDLSGLTVGDDVTCYLLDTGGGIECMGVVPSETVPPTSSSLPTAVSIASAPRPEVISARAGMVCGVQDGVLGCFGAGDDLVPLNNLVTWADVQVGASHICGTSTGTSTEPRALYCWGLNERGQAFMDSETTPFLDSPARVDLAGLFVSGADTEGTLHSYSVGLEHTCFIMTNAGVLTLYCTGYNHWGELGGTFGGGHGNVVRVGEGYAQVSAGAYYTCAVTLAGELDCWGKNHMGQLGNRAVYDTRNYSIHRVPAPEHGGVWRRVVAGTNHTCALTDDHTLYCWGSNASQQLSINTCDPGPFPEPTVVVHQFRDPTGCGS